MNMERYKIKIPLDITSSGIVYFMKSYYIYTCSTDVKWWWWCVCMLKFILQV